MRIVCLGSGNVATHLSRALKATGADIVQVYSKTLANAQALASVLNTQATDQLAQLVKDADFYILSVNDDAIVPLALQLRGIRGMVVHTSGATPIDVLADKGFANYGVLYPLQTFSKRRELDFSKVPLCLEAGDEKAMRTLRSMAEQLSPLVHEIRSADRRLLHLSAVFVCNFTNHLYHLGTEVLGQRQLSFDLLKPLILETAEKVQNALPYDVQTGPAVRNDEQTMQLHLALLATNPDLIKIYETLSKSIKKTYL